VSDRRTYPERPLRRPKYGLDRPVSAADVIATMSSNQTLDVEPATYLRRMPAFSVGLQELDHLTPTFPGDLWVVTGRSGAGKSVLATNVMRAALDDGLGVHVVLSRDDPEDLFARLVCAQRQISLNAMNGGRLTYQDVPKLEDEVARLASLPLSITARPATISAEDAVWGGALVEAACNPLLSNPRGLTVVEDMPPRQVAEHLERLRTLARRTANLILVNVADEGGVPLRKVEAAAAPVADVVLRVGPKRPQHDRGLGRPDETTIKIIRNRHGPLGTYRFAFEAGYGRFVAVSKLGLSGPNIKLSPPAGSQQVVGLPTWMWTTVSDATWTPHSATAAVAGESVTATATATSIDWSMGDGDTVTCDGPGTPYSPRFGAHASSPTCGYTYSSPSSTAAGGTFPVTGTTTWRITWVGGGQNGTLTLRRSTTVNVVVQEAEAVNS
jgi:hypothetical protein